MDAVVIGVARLVASLHPLQVAAQLGFIMVPLLNHASLLEVVEGEKGQSDPWGGFSKAKDVKLPVIVCLLRTNDVFLEG